jgi:sugar O-acyltransferase (sialic acid O-acetyltransferase NeuD family)
VSNNKNILLGYSGHGYVVAEAAMKAGLSINCYAEKRKNKVNPLELEYLGYEGDEDFEGWDKGFGFILGVGNNKIRLKLGELILQKEEHLLNVKHPSAEISDTTSIDVGSFVSSHVSINACSKIGKYVILNTNCVVEHECKIADGVHVAPGAVLAGNVTVGKGSFIGANAVIKEGITIGKNVIIGAGSTIIQDIPSGKKVVGNPGREI